MIKIENLIVIDGQEGVRLDKFIADSSVAMSRTRIQQLIEAGMIHLIPERVVSAAMKVKRGLSVETVSLNQIYELISMGI